MLFKNKLPGLKLFPSIIFVFQTASRIIFKPKHWLPSLWQNDKKFINMIWCIACRMWVWVAAGLDKTDSFPILILGTKFCSLITFFWKSGDCQIFIFTLFIHSPNFISTIIFSTSDALFLFQITI